MNSLLQPLPASRSSSNLGGSDHTNQHNTSSLAPAVPSKSCSNVSAQGIPRNAECRQMRNNAPIKRAHGVSLNTNVVDMTDSIKLGDSSESSFLEEKTQHPIGRCNEVTSTYSMESKSNLNGAHSNGSVSDLAHNASSESQILSLPKPHSPFSSHLQPGSSSNATNYPSNGSMTAHNRSNGPNGVSSRKSSMSGTHCSQSALNGSSQIINLLHPSEQDVPPKIPNAEENTTVTSDNTPMTSAKAMNGNSHSIELNAVSVGTNQVSKVPKPHNGNENVVIHHPPQRKKTTVLTESPISSMTNLSTERSQRAVKSSGGSQSEVDTQKQDNVTTNHMDRTKKSSISIDSEGIYQVPVKRKQKKRDLQPTLTQTFAVAPSSESGDLIQRPKDSVLDKDAMNTDNGNLNGFGPIPMAVDSEEEDEDYNAEEAEEEEDDEDDEDDDGEGSEDIGGDDFEDSLADDLADIDIVNDARIYTEPAPRWLISIDDGKEFNAANAYENWEQEKMENGGIIYSDDSDDHHNNNSNNNNNRNGNGMTTSPADEAPDFFQGLLAKYGSQKFDDPEEDQIKKKGRNEYDLTDSFVNDEDCFEWKGIKTLHPGFFIARGHIDVIRPQSASSPDASSRKKRNKTSKKASKPKEPIPAEIQKEIEPIRVAVQSHRGVMVHVVSDRFMNGILYKQDEYIKIMRSLIKKGGKLERNKINSNSNNNKIDTENPNGRVQLLSGSTSDTVHSDSVRNTYRSLLTMLMEFDCTLLGKDSKEMGFQLKYSIYGELAAVFGFDVDAKGNQQQTNFEELLNWFSVDWYDEPDEEMKTKKMQWRLKFLDRPKKRAKGRLTSRLRAVMKQKQGNVKQNKAVLNPEDIPWDGIVSEIYNLTTFDMEKATLNDADIDTASHGLHSSLHDTIGAFLVGGKSTLRIHDIEVRYNKYIKHLTAEQLNYSHIVVKRIKEEQRENKKRTSSKRKKSGKKRRSKSPRAPRESDRNHRSNQEIIDISSESPKPKEKKVAITNHSNHSNTGNTLQRMSISEGLTTGVTTLSTNTSVSLPVAVSGANIKSTNHTPNTNVSVSSNCNTTPTPNRHSHVPSVSLRNVSSPLTPTLITKENINNPEFRGLRDIGYNDDVMMVDGVRTSSNISNKVNTVNTVNIGNGERTTLEKPQKSLHQILSQKSKSPKFETPQSSKDMNASQDIKALAVPSLSANDRGAVIDLTDDISPSNSKMHSTTVPSLVSTAPPSALRQDRSSRKRKHHEMSPMTRNDRDELTQDMPSTPESKRRRIQPMNHRVSGPATSLQYPNADTFLKEGSLLISAVNGKLDDGAELVVLGEEVSSKSKHKKFKLRNYGTGDTVQFGEWENMYLVVPYVDTRSHQKNSTNTTSTDKVLVLAQNERTAQSGASAFVIGSVVEKPASMSGQKKQHLTHLEDGGTIGVKILNRQLPPMPLYKILQSKVTKQWNSLKIPTVVRIVSVIGSKYEERICNDLATTKAPKKEVKTKNKNADNVSTNVAPSPRRLPPQSNQFLMRLPNDPWASRHFQGSVQV